MGKLVSKWMSGTNIRGIATNILGANDSKSISKCVRIIYNEVTNSASWGLAAMFKAPSDDLTKEQKQSITNLPAKIYYGVDTDAAVLIRLNNIPRSIAKSMGSIYEDSHSVQESTPNKVRRWISGLDASQWEYVARSSHLTGTEFQSI